MKIISKEIYFGFFFFIVFFSFLFRFVSMRFFCFLLNSTSMNAFVFVFLFYLMGGIEELCSISREKQHDNAIPMITIIMIMIM